MSEALPTNNTRIWIEAMRPRTLPLAIASIVMGSALAAAWSPFSWPVAVMAVLTAVLLQILSNLANDYGDSQHGADSVSREGPQRAVQSGAITPRSMLLAMVLTAGLAALSGLLLLWLAFGSSGWVYILLFVLLGGAAIVAAVAYTAGVRPYGYAGLGDLSVFIFFGLVAVLGTYFLHTQRLDWFILLPASSAGLLAVAVLNVNNIRDLRSDALAGKHTIPVRLGPRRARLYHWLLLLLAVLAAAAYVAFNFTSWWQFLFLLAVPLLLRNGRAVWRTTSPLELNPLLKQLSLTTLLFVLLFSLGQVL